MNESEFVRNDVFHANMERMETLMERNLAKQEAIASEIKGNMKALDTKIEGVIDKFSVTINGINSRIDDMRDNQAQGLTKWGIIVALVVGLVQVSISLFMK